MAGLTTKGIEALKPGEARREVPDGLVPGLYMVVQPSGKKGWALRYRLGGKPAKMTLGAFPALSVAAARERARSALIEVAKGVDPAGAARVAKTEAEAKAERDRVSAVIDLFIERHAKPKQKSWVETRRVFDREVIPFWGARTLGSITRAEVHELLDRVVDRGSPIMANRVLAAVRKLFNWSVERGLVAASPCDKIKAPGAERSRDRILTDAELRAVWEAGDAVGWPFGPLVQLLLLTGQRREEVGAMRWAELDLDAGIWTLPKERAKNAKAHLVPLSPQAVAILRKVPRIEVEGAPGYVFTTTGATSISGFSKAKSRVDALVARELGETPPAWVIHDLRRTFASNLARLGTALPTIERLLNHISGPSFGGVAGVYQRHGFEPEMRRAVDAYGDFIGRLVDRSGSNVVALPRAS